MLEIIDTKEITEGTFPINLKLIKNYQQTEHILMVTYKYGIYHKGYFRGGSNINLKLIKYEVNIFIPSTLQSYALHFYHTFILIQELIERRQ